MTDLEMTKLCAEAMGWRPTGKRKDFDTVKAIPVEQFPSAPHYQYAPLCDDASAMALVKKFHLEIQPPDPENKNWVVFHYIGLFGDGQEDLDLNRAIVMCVASMQEEKRLDATLSEVK